MKKVVLIGVLSSVATMLCGCVRDEAEKSAVKPQESKMQEVPPEPNGLRTEQTSSASEKHLSSRDVVDRQLEERGIRQGVDVDKGRILTVSTCGFSLKGEERDEDELCETNETYDFHDAEGDDFETRRFKTVWKAYADGLANIARTVAMHVESDETVKGEMGNGGERQSRVQSTAELRLDGVVTVSSAESFDPVNREYEFTIAVCQSQKRQKLYKDNLIEGLPSPPGRYSLKEWVDENSSMGIICPQSFVDNEGVWWRVAGVPIEIDSGRTSTEIASSTGKAMHYAFEAAIRTIWVDVSANYVAVVCEGGVETHGKTLRMVSIKPISTVESPNDPFHVKWLELDKVDGFTGKPIRLFVCAVRDDAGAREAKKAALVERLKGERQAEYNRGRQDALRD